MRAGAMPLAESNAAEEPGRSGADLLRTETKC